MTMKNAIRRQALAIALALAVPLAHASEAGTLPAASGSDLVPAALVAAPPPAFALEREPVQFAWRLNPGQAIEAPQPFVQESREFWSNVDAAELQRGMRIDTTAPGAVIRISPALGARPTPLAIDDFELQVGANTLPAGQAFESAADHAALQAAGTDFPSGTVAFRLRPELGDGAVHLRNARAQGRYLVHVFEPHSPVRMLLGSSRDIALNGQRLEISGRLFDGDRPLRAQRLGGLLTSPDGRSFELDFTSTRDGELLAAIDLPESASSVPGLWEIHAFAVHEARDRIVLRDAKTAVSIVAPTARLAGGYRVDRGDGLRFDFDVDTASEGRYELRAVLFGTDGNGQLRPMANAHSAAWLDAGGGTIGLHFPADVMGSGFQAPFELRELALSDQGRIARLERREAGPRLDAAQRRMPRR